MSSCPFNIPAGACRPTRKSSGECSLAKRADEAKFLQDIRKAFENYPGEQKHCTLNPGEVCFQEARKFVEKLTNLKAQGCKSKPTVGSFLPIIGNFISEFDHFFCPIFNAAQGCSEWQKFTERFPEDWKFAIVKKVQQYLWSKKNVETVESNLFETVYNMMKITIVGFC